jgi:6-phosphogluconate dehydrogenase (decarboxylating)
MQIGVIGLGRMGGNISRRLIKAWHYCVVFGYARFRSRQEHTFGEKMLSAMRFGFGGHIEGNEPIDPEPKPKQSQGGSAAKDAAK